MWYLIGAGVVVIGILGYLLLRSTKNVGKMTVEKKDVVETNTALKQQVDIAAENITPEDAYAGLKGGKGGK